MYGSGWPKLGAATPISKNSSSTRRSFAPISLLPALPKNGGDQAIGRSRGGLTTKIHASVDALGNPWRLILTGGQEADVTQGAALVSAIPTGAVIADKGYDSDALIETIEASGAQAIIPPRSHRTIQRKTDWHRYKARNLVERFFNRLKPFRRLATRYDQLANRFNAFLHLACAYIWLL